MYRGYLPPHVFRVRRWTWFALGVLAMFAVMLAMLGGCAFRYNKYSGGYEGALACVNITGPGFSWTCTEQSKVPALAPETPQPGKP